MSFEFLTKAKHITIVVTSITRKDSIELFMATIMDDFDKRSSFFIMPISSILHFSDPLGIYSTLVSQRLYEQQCLVFK